MSNYSKLRKVEWIGYLEIYEIQSGLERYK